MARNTAPEAAFKGILVQERHSDNGRKVGASLTVWVSRSPAGVGLIHRKRTHQLNVVSAILNVVGQLRSYR